MTLNDENYYMTLLEDLAAKNQGASAPNIKNFERSSG